MDFTTDFLGFDDPNKPTTIQTNPHSYSFRVVLVDRLTKMAIYLDFHLLHLSTPSSATACTAANCIQRTWKAFQQSPLRQCLGYGAL
jgi:hypothetical protein